MEILEIPVKFAILVASISSVKYFRISLNLASEILERTIYLFFNFAMLVTFQDHSSRRNFTVPLCELKLERAKYFYKNRTTRNP